MSVIVKAKVSADCIVLSDELYGKLLFEYGKKKLTLGRVQC